MLGSAESQVRTGAKVRAKSDKGDRWSDSRAGTSSSRAAARGSGRRSRSASRPKVRRSRCSRRTWTSSSRSRRSSAATLTSATSATARPSTPRSPRPPRRAGRCTRSSRTAASAGGTHDGLGRPLRRRSSQTNLFGTYWCIRAAVRHLAPGPERRDVVVIASILARIAVARLHGLQRLEGGPARARPLLLGGARRRRRAGERDLPRLGRRATWRGRGSTRSSPRPA